MIAFFILKFFLRRRAYSSKTRIKTFMVYNVLLLFSYVGEHIPVKQGLRRSLLLAFCFSDCVGEHIPVKQGLRLVFHYPQVKDVIGRRAYSSKTRIKTLLRTLLKRWLRFVGEHIPVKQGLRHCKTGLTVPLPAVGEHIPVKQGLRLYIAQDTLRSMLVGEHIPVKQGLRHVISIVFRIFYHSVGEHIPVKQGWMITCSWKMIGPLSCIRSFYLLLLALYILIRILIFIIFSWNGILKCLE